MNRLLAVAAILVLAFSARAQDAAKIFEDVEKQNDWNELFDGVTLRELQVDEPIIINNGQLIVGGARPRRLRLKAPLGDQFKLLIECRFDGPVAPSLVLALQSFGARGESTYPIRGATAGEWQELLYIRKDAGRGKFAIDTLTRKADDKTVRSAGQIGGSGTVSLSWEVPAGTTLTIKRIRLQTTTSSNNGLFIALGILALIILMVVAVGWFLNRRKTAAKMG